MSESALIQQVQANCRISSQEAAWYLEMTSNDVNQAISLYYSMNEVNQVQTSSGPVIAPASAPIISPTSESTTSPVYVPIVAPASALDYSQLHSVPSLYSQEPAPAYSTNDPRLNCTAIFFENERWYVGKGWGGTLPTDRSRFSNGTGSRKSDERPSFTD
eukprot:Awhi_evm1s8508